MPYDFETHCLPALPAGLRRFSVSSQHVSVQTFGQSRVRWTIGLLSVLALSVGLTALSQIIGERVPLTLLPSEKITLAEESQQGQDLQKMHFFLMLMDYLSSTLQATCTQTAAFLKPGCSRQKIKRLARSSLHLLIAFTVNTFFCLAHCSQTREWLGPWLMATWGFHVGAGLFLSGHVGAPTAVIEASDEKPHSAAQTDVSLLAEKQQWVRRALPYVPLHWLSMCRPCQLEHDKDKEKKREPWHIQEEEIVSMVVMVAIVSLSVGVMFAVCNKTHLGVAYVEHFFGLIAAGSVLFPLLRRGMELGRQPTARTILATSFQSAFSLPAVFLACMTEGWGLAAVFAAAMFQLSQSALPVSVQRRVGSESSPQRAAVLPVRRLTRPRSKKKCKKVDLSKSFLGGPLGSSQGNLKESLLGDGP